MSTFQTNTQKTKGFGTNVCNPIFKSIGKRREEFVTDDTQATYSGIISKTVFLLLMVFAGFAAFFVSHSVTMGMAPTLAATDASGIYDIQTNYIELGIAVVMLVMSIVLPIAGIFLRAIMPAIGILYALTQGFFIGMITEFLAPEYKWASMLALVLTATIVAVMLVLYSRRIIKATEKFRTVVSSIFVTMLIGGLLMFILTLIPFTRPMAMGVVTFMNSPVIGVILGIVYIVVAALFLIVDFDNIESCVRDGMPKKYEWMCAVGLCYTIIYIYFKVLELILRIAKESK